jgi:CheY-like chemotaxis protein
MARICLHEPNPETRDLLGLLVTRLGHDVVERDADLVLVEPVEDGWGAVGLARDANPHARMIICSIALHDRDELTLLRADGFLLKPFGLSELRAALVQAQAPAQAAGGS